jgi:hypothetical protein
VFWRGACVKLLALRAIPLCSRGDCDGPEKQIPPLRCGMTNKNGLAKILQTNS